MTDLFVEVIVGSVREGRIGMAVADWFVARAAQQPDWSVSVIDLAELVLPTDFSPSEATEQLRRRIERADAVVAVTPEYNHGYSASLKTALDSVKHEWRAKPIGFVSYGGVSGGLRATEQLRQVVAELHMVSVRQSVSIHQARKQFRAPNPVLDPIASDAADRMIDQLDWWGRGLRDHRGRQPYPG
ncbi:NAD(P)H-dependent oxidoreductase [Rhodococcus sp. KBS0724]|jgi:NAD(P)H-dependent FMN reductase|uniref:NADPH-dependent FMN reductase n=1 Tax=Rhodococcus sp. KBS0724 TaxID=1179674 RepID=UPI00110EEA7E|nr:NAD(P)H-dependent oxidoreductase [Rhodococcus sp. KBS0724]TSD48354.1 NAD(P)H-dependent oxidoreductase [Rhodococcus sp. KBS0724]